MSLSFSSRRVVFWVLSVLVLGSVVALGVTHASANAARQMAGAGWEPQLAALTAHADLIVRGRVVGSRAHWNDEHTQIVSDQQVAVHYTLSGHSPAMLLLSTPGGFLPEENIGLYLSHTPTLNVGEEVLLFLRTRVAGAQSTDAIAGKMTVVNGKVKHEESATSFPIHQMVAQVEAEMHAAARQSTLPPEWRQIEATASVAAAAVTAPLSYVYTGYKWNVNEVSFVVNPQSASLGADNGLADDFRNAIVAAATTWNMEPNADFNFVDAGPTTATATSRNHVNEVLFVSRPDRSAAGITELWFNSRNVILEADIFINDVYAWDATGAPAASELDLQSAVLHEFGHWLALGHDDDSAAVMAPAVTAGALHRDLHPNDQAGIAFVYPCAQPPCLPSTPAPTLTPTPTATPTPIAVVSPIPTPLPTVRTTPEEGQSDDPSSPHPEVTGFAIFLPMVTN